VAVIEEDRHGLSRPSRGEDQINCMISIDVPCFDKKPARRRNKLKRLPPCCGELELNPVAGIAVTVLPSLNAGQIWTKVSVKIRNRKLWARSAGSDPYTMKIRGLRSAAANEAKQQQERYAQKQAAQHPAANLQVCSASQFARDRSHRGLSGTNAKNPVYHFIRETENREIALLFLIQLKLLGK
jgi:hypothetical protein